MTRKIYDYEVTTTDDGIVESITGKNREGSYSRLYPFQFNHKYNSWLRLDNLTFNQLRGGIYRDTIHLF